MKLGFEARWLTAGPVSGRTVVEGLLEPLVAITGDRAVELVLYVDRRGMAPTRQRFSGFSHVTVRGLPFRNRWLTITALLGHLADRDGVDVLVTQAFTPRFGKAKRLLYVLDILFESHPQFFTPLERLYFRRVRPSCRRADGIIAISEFTKGQLVEYGYAPPERITVVHCGADRPSPRGANAGRLSRHLPDRYFLYVGRLNDRKNLGTLVEAAGQVLPALDAHLVIVGGSDGRYSQRALTPPAAVRDRVHVLGYVGDAELGEIYRRALALVYVPFVEGFGLPVVEAMQYGLPVIASNSSGIREALGDAGIAVNPQSAREIAAAMRAVAEDPARRRDLSERSRRRAAAFSWETAARQVLDVAQRLAPHCGGG